MILEFEQSKSPNFEWDKISLVTSFLCLNSYYLRNNFVKKGPGASFQVHHKFLDLLRCSQQTRDPTCVIRHA